MNANQQAKIFQSLAHPMAIKKLMGQLRFYSNYSQFRSIGNVKHTDTCTGPLSKLVLMSSVMTLMYFVFFSEQHFGVLHHPR